MIKEEQEMYEKQVINCMENINAYLTLKDKEKISLYVYYHYLDLSKETEDKAPTPEKKDAV